MLKPFIMLLSTKLTQSHNPNFSDLEPQKALPGSLLQPVPSGFWPFCHHLLSTSYNDYTGFRVLRHEDALCYRVIMKKS